MLLFVYIFLYIYTEDVIHKSFRILASSLTSQLLETFSSQFWHRGKVTGPFKACELAAELSWLPLTCVQKGVLYEGYLHNPALKAKMDTDLQHMLKLYAMMKPSTLH